MIALAVAVWAAAAMAPHASIAPASVPDPVVRAALAYAAKEEGAGACARRQLQPSFLFTSLILAPDSADGARRKPGFRWSVPHDGDARGHELDVRDAGELNRALNAALASSAPAESRISPEDVPAGLRLTGHACRHTITLSSPIVTGDIAFVEIGYVCGPYCGGAELIALRLHGGEWQVYAGTGLAVA